MDAQGDDPVRRAAGCDDPGCSHPGSRTAAGSGSGPLPRATYTARLGHSITLAGGGSSLTMRLTRVADPASGDASFLANGSRYVAAEFQVSDPSNKPVIGLNLLDSLTTVVGSDGQTYAADEVDTVSHCTSFHNGPDQIVSGQSVYRMCGFPAPERRFANQSGGYRQQRARNMGKIVRAHSVHELKRKNEMDQFIGGTSFEVLAVAAMLYGATHEYAGPGGNPFPGVGGDFLTSFVEYADGTGTACPNSSAGSQTRPGPGSNARAPLQSVTSSPHQRGSPECLTGTSWQYTGRSYHAMRDQVRNAFPRVRRPLPSPSWKGVALSAGAETAS